MHRILLFVEKCLSRGSTEFQKHLSSQWILHRGKIVIRTLLKSNFYDIDSKLPVQIAKHSKMYKSSFWESHDCVTCDCLPIVMEIEIIATILPINNVIYLDEEFFVKILPQFQLETFKTFTGLWCYSQIAINLFLKDLNVTNNYYYVNQWYQICVAHIGSSCLFNSKADDFSLYFYIIYTNY